MIGRYVAAAVVGTATVVGGVTGIFSVDDRYYKTAEAAEYRQQADIDRETGDVSLRIKLIELELQMGPDERRRILLERQLEQLLDRQNSLIDLQRGW